MQTVNHYYSPRRYLITKIECFTRLGYRFSHISETTITFVTKFNNMAFKNYLKRPKSIAEWKLIEN